MPVISRKTIAEKLTFNANQAVSATIGNDGAETAYNRSYTIPANRLVAGSVIHIKACVQVIGAAAGAETLLNNVRIGGLAGTLLAATTAVNGVQNEVTFFDIIVIIRTAGSAGTLVAMGFKSELAASAAGVLDPVFLGSTAINTTVAQQIVVTADWSAAAADATSALQILEVEINRG